MGLLWTVLIWAWPPVGPLILGGLTAKAGADQAGTGTLSAFVSVMCCIAIWASVIPTGRWFLYAVAVVESLLAFVTILDAINSSRMK